MSTVNILLYCLYLLAQVTGSTRMLQLLEFRLGITRSRTEANTIRRVFRNFKFCTFKQNSANHSHPNAAMLRSAANQSVDNFIYQVGYTPYSVSMSQRDVDAGNDGQRFHYHAKDHFMEERNDEVTGQHILKMIDVDYYADINFWMSLCRPILLYSFNPNQTAGQLPDAHFYTDGDEVIVTVKGGARYVHKMWNYDHDHVVSHHWFGSVIWNVEKVAAPDDPHRHVVLLLPNTVKFFWSGWRIKGPQITRRTFKFGSSQIWSFLSEEAEPMVSISRERGYSAVTIPDSVLCAIASRCQNKRNATIADIERVLASTKTGDPTIDAPTLYDCMDDIMLYLKWKKRSLDSGFLTAPDVFRYQSAGPLVYEDGSPSMRIVGKPMAPGGVAPDKSFNNDVACVRGRLTKIQNVVDPKPAYKMYSREFVKRLIPKSVMHTGCPWSLEEVENRQRRPTQRIGWSLVAWFSRMQVAFVKSFQKVEPYKDCKAPRNISQLNPDHRTRYGSFIYPFTKSVLKCQPWYAFGKTPAKLVARLRKVCSNAEFVIPTDFSSFDGTHSQYLCDLEHEMGTRFFRPEFHDEWTNLQRQQYQASASTKFGVRYNTMFTRLSGSADTSTFNSVNNALIAYSVLRSSGMDADRAWNSLGVYGGDDGLTANVDPGLYSKVSSAFGLILKSEKVFPGSKVTFLGRDFIDPWTTDDSTIDVARQVRKLHLTGCKNVPERDVLINKADGILTTDSNTPLLSHWARAVHRIYGDKLNVKYKDMLTMDRSWFSRVDYLDSQFPQADPEHPALWDSVASNCETTVPHLRALCRQLDRAKSIEDFPDESALPNIQPKFDIAVVSHGELRGECNENTFSYTDNVTTEQKIKAEEATKAEGRSSVGHRANGQCQPRRQIHTTRAPGTHLPQGRDRVPVGHKGVVPQSNGVKQHMARKANGAVRPREVPLPSADLDPVRSGNFQRRRQFLRRPDTGPVGSRIRGSRVQECLRRDNAGVRSGNHAVDQTRPAAVVPDEHRRLNAKRESRQHQARTHSNPTVRREHRLVPDGLSPPGLRRGVQKSDVLVSSSSLSHRRPPGRKPRLTGPAVTATNIVSHKRSNDLKPSSVGKPARR